MHIVLIIILIIGVALIRATTSQNKSRKIETIFCGLVIFLYAALRGENVGTDLFNYCYNYSEIGKWSISDILNKMNHILGIMIQYSGF